LRFPATKIILQRAALIGRLFCACGKAQDSGEIAVSASISSLPSAFGVSSIRFMSARSRSAASARFSSAPSASASAAT
jgi:hypothetical protein